jgi:5-formyltetrahydrofolate cyclo-ligase
MTNDKAELRRLIRSLKSQVSPDEKSSRSESIIHQLETLHEFNEARVVLMYWSMADEVQTHALVERWYGQKTILLPCVDGDDLLLRQYTGPECLKSGEQFGIGEPTGPVYTQVDQVEMIVVPGVAFDRKGNRMGRGRGFYDRLLKSTPNAYKVGVAFDFQMLDDIPMEPFDVPMDDVITEI